MIYIMNITINENYIVLKSHKSEHRIIFCKKQSKDVIGETPSGDFPIFHKQFIDIYLKVISTLRVRIRVHRNLLRKLIKSRHE